MFHAATRAARSPEEERAKKRLRHSCDSPSLQCDDEELFRGLGGSDTGILVRSVLLAIENAGILTTSDPRIEPLVRSLDAIDKGEPLSRANFMEAASDNLAFLHRIATGELAVEDFPSFKKHIRDVVEHVKELEQLSLADCPTVATTETSTVFGVAFFSVDGQFCEIGDTRARFTLENASDPLTFALALERAGVENMLNWCGVEAAVNSVDEMNFLRDSRPVNPMTRGGSLTVAGILASTYPWLTCKNGALRTPEEISEDIYLSALLPFIRALSGNGVVGDVQLSEAGLRRGKEDSYLSIAQAHALRAGKRIPSGVHIGTMVDLHLRAGSMSTNAASLSHIAATLANGGRSPLTGEQLLGSDVVRKTLSLMSICGIGENSGDFFFHIGLPSKSGRTGVMFSVLPDVGGFAVFSPQVNGQGVSNKARSFTAELVRRFSFHAFERAFPLTTRGKLTASSNMDFSTQRGLYRLRWALRAGDKRVQNFADLLVETCVRLARIEGSLEISDVETIDDTFQSIMKCRIPVRSVVRARSDIPCQKGEVALRSLYQRLSGCVSDLDYTSKLVILDACFSVALADGALSDAERDFITCLSSALCLDRSIVDIRVKELESVTGMRM